MARKSRKPREPSVIRKVITVLYEDAKRKKALRLLARQSWSLDFLSMALVKAGQHLGEGIAIAIENRDGTRITLTYDAARKSRAVQDMDDSVFMHLDDDLAVERFIRENSRR